jgi:hypothetical protein
MESSHNTIGEFSLGDTVSCGAEIRRIARRTKDQASFGHALLEYFRQRFMAEDGTPAIALARMFITDSYERLDPALQAIVQRSFSTPSAEMKCLRMCATAGSEPAWNDIAQSISHRVIPLPGEEAIEQLPMIAGLLQQLEFDVGGLIHSDERMNARGSQTGVFHVEEALGSIYIPAQDEFVRRFEIRSVVGFGDILPDRNIFAVIMFSRAKIPSEVAELFSLLSLSVRSALLPWCS